MQKSKQSVGVVIGRFQIPSLHEGHKHLLDYAAARHNILLVLIGHNDIRFTPRDPMPYEMRQTMLEQAYPKAVVRPLPDSKVSNDHWSQTLDKIVGEVAAGQGAVLYGSRDSFIPYYSGKFATHEVPPVEGISATNIRNGCSDPIATEAGRRAWIAAIQRQRMVTDSVVDMAIVSQDWQSVLLGRRGPGGLLGFFGGFVDPTDSSDEAAAVRERTEEVVGIETAEPEYVGSCIVDDPRYRGSGSMMRTRFFVCEYLSGGPQGADDMPLVEWMPLDLKTLLDVKPSHIPLFNMLLEHRSLYHTPDFGID